MATEDRREKVNSVLDNSQGETDRLGRLRLCGHCLGQLVIMGKVTKLGMYGAEDVIPDSLTTRSIDLVAAIASGEVDAMSVSEFEFEVATTISRHVFTKMMAMSNERNTMSGGRLYAIRNQANKALKFGYSVNPQSRLESLQTANSGELSLIGSVAATQKQEREVHDLLRAYHVRGEWFRSCESTERVARLVECGRSIEEILSSTGGDTLPLPSLN